MVLCGNLVEIVKICMKQIRVTFIKQYALLLKGRYSNGKEKAKAKRKMEELKEIEARNKGNTLTDISVKAKGMGKRIRN